MHSTSRWIITGALVLAACRSRERPASDTSAGTVPPSPPPATGTAAAPGGALAAPLPGSPPPGATAAMAALGDSIFHGQAAGGLCYTCHGPDAKGTTLAPPLIKHEWRTGDGTYDFIQKRVTTGVPNPSPPYTTPMLPFGGASLNPAQLKAVSAYVYSISR